MIVEGDCSVLSLTLKLSCLLHYACKKGYDRGKMFGCNFLNTINFLHEMCIASFQIRTQVHWKIHLEQLACTHMRKCIWWRKGDLVVGDGSNIVFECAWVVNMRERENQRGTQGKKI